MTLQIYALISIVACCVLYLVHAAKHPFCPHCRARYRQVIPSKAEPWTEFTCETCGKTAKFLEIWNFNLL